MTEQATLDPALDALLALAAERPWRHISLRDIAERAGEPLSQLYARAPSKTALLAQLSAAFDNAALDAPREAEADAQDVLFETVMARVEAMEPYRAALVAIAEDSRTLSEGPAFALHFPRTARALLEGAGIEPTPPRVLAMTALWARVATVWRDDEGALNRTMAEIDKRLKTLRSNLARIGAGF